VIEKVSYVVTVHLKTGESMMEITVELIQDFMYITAKQILSRPIYEAKKVFGYIF
jgi:hypothetical protein